MKDNDTSASQSWRDRLRRLSVGSLILAVGLGLFSVPAGAATRSRQVTDSKYAIAFKLPATWRHPLISMTSKGSTKVLVRDVSGSSILGLVQVQVIGGRHTNASVIASGIVQTTPEATVLGSSIAKFSFGKAEQLRFSIPTSSQVVYGIVEAFYLHKQTYIVAFDSVNPGINVQSRSAVMGSWTA